MKLITAGLDNHDTWQMTQLKRDIKCEVAIMFPVDTW